MNFPIRKLFKSENIDIDLIMDFQFKILDSHIGIIAEAAVAAAIVVAVV
jgi:hypothetical protein